ncbi:MAG: tetratricopeptide repeat protein [Spirochaetota bacterium]|nr:MAG: tetratricopeptide repeat protein [Spirochaetota bacterium]
MKKQEKIFEEWHQIPELSKQGYNLLKERRYREAESRFQKILQFDKKNIYALVGLGDVYKGEKNFKQAEDYYQEALKVDPVNKFALIGLADTYRGLKNFKDAIKTWEEYLSFGENEYDISVLTRLGDTYKKTGMTDQALEQYNKAISMDPSNPYALSGLALLHFQLGNYQKSLSYWNTLLKIEEDGIKVLTNIGNCYRKLNKYNDALKYFYRAMNIEENNFYALYGIADSYRGLKDYRKACEYWKKLLKRDPQNKKILTRVGDSYRNLGDLKTSRSYYNRALEVEFDYYAILGLSMLDKAEKNYEAATQNLNQLITISGLNTKLALLLSECHVAMNNFDLGIKILGDAVKKGSKSEEIKKRLKLLKKHKT